MERALLLLYLSPADSSFLPKEQMLPPEGAKRSSLETRKFLPWKRKFPPLETLLSSLGNFLFQGRKAFGNLARCVLSLKKGHSWGGVTEMVHGSFC